MTARASTPRRSQAPQADRGLRVSDLGAVHGGQQVLRGVELTVHDRQLACVLGPSGCGKTTLLRAIAGFHRPATGRIMIDGRVLDDGRTHVPAERRGIGYIPQDVALFPHLSVAANIGFGLPRGRRSAKVADLLDLIDLADHAGRHPHQLSGGQQQRVALARALATDPALLLLDEPFSALDATLRDRVRTDVADLLRRAGIGAVLVTHDAAEAMAFADHLTVMDGGAVLQSGTPQTLFTAPTTAAVARALGDANVVPASVDGGLASTPLGRVPLAGHAGGADQHAFVLVRPHQIVLTAAPSADDVRAVVRSTEYRGVHHRVEIEVGSSGIVATAHSDRPLAIDQAVGVTITGTAHVLDRTSTP